jgi:hypothetical protein
VLASPGVPEIPRCWRASGVPEIPRRGRPLEVRTSRGASVPPEYRRAPEVWASPEVRTSRGGGRFPWCGSRGAGAVAVRAASPTVSPAQRRARSSAPTALRAEPVWVTDRPAGRTWFATTSGPRQPGGLPTPMISISPRLDCPLPCTTSITGTIRTPDKVPGTQGQPVRKGHSHGHGGVAPRGDGLPCSVNPTSGITDDNYTTIHDWLIRQ